jgi:hypothetical protein
MKRDAAILVAAVAVLLVGGIGAAVLLLSGGLSTEAGLGGTPSAEVPPAPLEWTGPVRVERGEMAVQRINQIWSEEPGTEPGWADVVRVELVRESANWRVVLGDTLPERAALARADRILAIGFVMETTGDAEADFVVGIDNDAPDGQFHVWLTDLATGQTQDRVGPPYGDPFDFAHSWESAERPPGGPEMPPGAVFFNVGFAPPEVFDADTVRFYAWSSLTESGEVVAWDYAPDFGWLTGGPTERLGCTPLACPMEGPAPGPGSREWVITVENTDNRAAHLFVARDEQPMGELVGSALPASVPPGATVQVVFSVPAGAGWAIFVNPTATIGAMIGAQDVPSAASGVLRISIRIDSSGNASWSAPAP